MMNQPTPENTFAHHKIYATHIYPLTGQLDITVGSWATENSDTKPDLLTLLQLTYGEWLPEYFDGLEQTVNDHPDWSGLAPHRPNPECLFNWHTKQWEDPRTLDERKTVKWAQIKQARSQAECAGFTWDGSTFDSDVLSQQRITGAAILAQMNDSFSINWTLKNNTVRPFNADQMKEVGTALGAHVAAQFARAQGIRVQIEAAQTPEEVATLDW